jgi:hypothetical protein
MWEYNQIFNVFFFYNKEGRAILGFRFKIDPEYMLKAVAFNEEWIKNYNTVN